MSARHLWVSGGRRADRARLVDSLDLPPRLLPGLSTVDAHRRLRGPYTMAGTLLRELVPGLLASDPELVRRHDIEILSVAPELRELVPATRETLTSLAVPAERTRFYSRLRTLRIAHGLAELLRDHLAGASAQSLVVESVEYADPTDAELLAVLLRRLRSLTLVVCTGDSAVVTPELAPERLEHALSRYAVRHPVEQSTVDGVDDAIAYVQGDCVSDDPVMLATYASLEPAERAELHDVRADELDALGTVSVKLGAIPYHRERGSDIAAATDALRFALDYSIDMGFYDATVDYGLRGREIIDWVKQFDHWWAFTTKMTTSLAALGRAAEAEELYDEARS